MSPRFRIHCEMRAPRGGGYRVFRSGWASSVGEPQPVRFDVEARNEQAALEEFFKDQAGALENVGWLDDNGRRNPIRGWEIDPRRRYTWIDEEGALMEYKSIRPLGDGLVPCPLCGGAGEVPEEAGDEYPDG